jgi:Fe2+ transport system protein FeoA
MRANDSLIGKIIKVTDVPQNNPCQNCKPCVRLRLMELGLVDGQKIRIDSHKLGLWIIHILGIDTDDTVYTLALRDEEIERILFEEDDCKISFVNDLH